MNNVNLIGRIAKDLELKVTNSGKYVLQFPLAVNRLGGKDAEQQADFISCVAWGKTAELLNQYMSKGSLIGVVGRLATRNYDNKNGQKVYVTEVVVDEVQFLEKKSTTASSNNQQYTYNGFDSGIPVNIASDDLPF